MKAATLRNFMVIATGSPEGEIEQRTRPLRDNNMIPYGPRGVHAPDIEAIHAALMLLSLTARRVAGVGKITIRASKLEAVEREGVEIRNANLADTLAQMFETEEFNNLQRLEVVEDGSMAWMRFPDKDVMFTDDENIIKLLKKNPSAYDDQGSGMARFHRTFGIGLLKQIAFQINDTWRPDSDGEG